MFNKKTSLSILLIIGLSLSINVNAQRGVKVISPIITEKAEETEDDLVFGQEIISNQQNLNAQNEIESLSFGGIVDSYSPNTLIGELPPELRVVDELNSGDAVIQEKDYIVDTVTGDRVYFNKEVIVGLPENIEVIKDESYYNHLESVKPKHNVKDMGSYNRDTIEALTQEGKDKFSRDYEEFRLRH